ncbi:MaoC family dehydratase [Henriciella litoralis]|uniref:MaoC family dehydratase n=1 Tax=Henriciella litoralis TaxID=568102 RepID=UPI000A055F3C|nr:MaoC family dehydratase [Henriciella litoralis]
MPIYFPDILSEATVPREFSYDQKDVMLYALGIGMSEEADGLDFVYEKNLQVVPTAATVLGGSIMPALSAAPGTRKSSYHFAKVVHASQKVTLNRPLLAADTLTTQTRTTDVVDKGPDRGAIVTTQTRWTDRDGVLVATLDNTIMARADGGFGGPSTTPASSHSVPSRPADQSILIATREDQALVYRLNGDSNPLHADPAVAQAAGFPRPILHGLCTYGLTCRAVLRAYANMNAARVLSHEARFSAPVFPGDVLKVDMWKNGDAIHFEASVPQRDVVVVRGGYTVLSPASESTSRKTSTLEKQSQEQS